jgi:hypothetical protein
MIIAIRDDDTSFFTKPQELEEAYDFITEGCVSLSVVPYTVPCHIHNQPYGDGYEYKQYDIAGNTELVEYLKRNIAEHRYSVMLHGSTHEYREIDGVWKPEMIWKDSETIHREMAEGKKHLMDLLDTDIDVFVAPSNAINQKAIDAVEKNGLHYSGVIGKTKDRKLDAKYVANYLHRAFYKMRYDIPYGGVYHYAGHDELYAYAAKSEEYVMQMYRICRQQGLPFVVYTHYWDLLKNQKTKETLRSFYEFAMADGAKLVSVSECFK